MKERIPAKPFMDWIERRIERYEKQYRFGGEKWGSSDAVQRVAYDLGTTGRRLYYYRYGLQQTTANGRKVDVKVDSFRRDRVEEMLWHADCFLWEVYVPEEFPHLFEEQAA